MCDSGLSEESVEGAGVAVDGARSASDQPRPVFAMCGECGADAQTYVMWDPGVGWSCLNCFATDGGY